MLKQVRQALIHRLWENYRHSTTQMQTIEASLKRKGIEKMVPDHFAIIDLPGPHTGINPLKQIFSAIGYVEQGKDYLPTKQNDFLWMAEADSASLPANEALPQVVLADFRLEELPDPIKKIIEKYSYQANHASLSKIKKLTACVTNGDAQAIDPLLKTLTDYLSGRDWPLPTIDEFYTVQKFNELIAWVLVFGRRPNHFTLSVHHLGIFADIMEFQHYLEEELRLELNQEGGKIKGDATSGMAQGSTMGLLQPVKLSDGEIELSTGFVEFVWRYPLLAHSQPKLWNDYFTGFRAQHANHIIESLYQKEEKNI
jgi:hypothetical protein